MALLLGGFFSLAGVPPAPAQAQTPLRGYYDDGFILETEDGAFQLRVRGNLHLDTRLSRSETPGAVESFDIRRARIDLLGRVYERVTFRLQSELAGSPYLRNAWTDWRFGAGLRVRWGQMKVPFSASWLTQGNQVNFVERGTARPVHPFFDRGFVVWGELLDRVVTYEAGVFTGVGIDADVPSGDVDSGKEWAGRLFLRPFLHAGGSLLEGLAVAVGGTWAGLSVPTSRYETRGHRSANFASALWRWRTEQVLGTDGHVVDRVAAEIASRRRLGVELHYVRGPLALSTELLEVQYDGVAIHHDFYVGSTRVAHVPLVERSGSVRSWSTWASYYLTGESKPVIGGGWQTARPERRVGEGGPGAVELLARYSRTASDPALFDAVTVAGLPSGAAELPAGYTGATPGAGNSVTAAVLDGAHAVNEVTVGVNWAVNPNVRVQLNNVFLWAPTADRDGDGTNDNLLVSGAFTAQSDPELRYRRTEWENAVMLRLIFTL
ncbi:MAG: porin [Longimicrobiales bacterium]